MTNAPEDGSSLTLRPDAPASAKGGAVRGGVGCGAAGMAVLAAVGLFGAFQCAGGGADAVGGWLAVVGIAGVGFGLAVVQSASGDDEKNHLRQRSPELPLSLADDGTPVWITGSTVCPQPLAAPHFGVPCAWMHAKATQRRGKRTETIHEEITWARTWIDDGVDRAEIRLARSDLQQLPKWTAKVGSVEHTLTFLPADGPLSVAGVARRVARPPAGSPGNRTASATPAEPATRAVEDIDFDANEKGVTIPGDATFEADPVDAEEAAGTPEAAGTDAPRVLVGEPDLPVLVTPLARHDWTAHTESKELQNRTMGWTLLVAGAAVGAAGAGHVISLWDVTGPFAWIGAIVVAAIAVGVPLRRSALERIGVCRARAEEAAAALEADLARAATDPTGAGVRVEARLRVYDQLATEYNDLLVRFPTSYVARSAGATPLPLHGKG